MPNYRLFIFDRKNRFVDARPISCETDEYALSLAAQLRTDEHGAEVWNFDRIVGTFPPEKQTQFDASQLTRKTLLPTETGRG